MRIFSRKVANEMRSGNKIWSAVGSFLVIAMLSLSVCINACADIAPGIRIGLVSASP